MRSNILLAVLLCLSIPCYANIFYINAEGTGDYPTIQAAIDAAQASDTVIAADGIYNIGNPIDFLGKAITVRSEYGPGNCVINCEGSGRGFKFVSGEGRDSVLDGFTIVNGDSNTGGGIKVDGGCSPTIENCIIKDCQADYGGGIYCGAGSDALIRNCRIINNKATDAGGGVYCVGTEEDTASITIEGCEMVGNKANDSNGGGVYAEYCQEVSMSGSTFTGNESPSGGGGIRVFSVDVEIGNCVFTKNRSGGSGGGIRVSAERVKVSNSIFIRNISQTYGGGLRTTVDVSAEIVNCTFVDNDAVEGGGVSCSGDSTIVNSIFKGNTGGAIYGDADVSYCLLGGEGEPDPLLNAAGRLRLGSPCINAGDNTAVEPGSTDLDGNARIIDGVVDIGAYEYTGVSRLMVSPMMFNFSAYHGQPDAISGEVVLTSDYPMDDIDWLVVEKDDLIEVNKTGGSVPAGGFDKIIFTIDASGLEVGYYAPRLVIAPASDLGDRRVINVYIRVVEPLMFPQEYDYLRGAVYDADDGDIIVVADGVYDRDEIYVSDFDKAVTVRSANGPERCIIDLQGYGRAFTFRAGASRESVLDGFTIINGGGTSYGGAIRINEGASPIIQNCVIRDCGAYEGGAIYCFGGSNALIRNCVINNNAADEGGGGIYCEGDYDGYEGSYTGITIEGCEISGNKADDSGGGLCVDGLNEISISDSLFAYNRSTSNGGGIKIVDSGEVKISGCTFADNECYEGKGGGAKVNGKRIEVSNCIFRDNVCDNYGSLGGGIRTTTGIFAEIVNCTFIGNEAYEGGGASCGGDTAVVNSIFAGNTNYGIAGEVGETSIHHCAFKQNPDGAYYGSGSVYDVIAINGLAGCYGNINPELLLTADGHLQAESLYINAGDSAGDYSGQSDMDGENRVYGGAVDIGADEFIDSDGDGLADWWEIKFFGSVENGAAGEDSDGDGKSNLDEYNDNTNPVGPYYVAVNGNDFWDGITAEWDGLHGPKATIQAAIDVSFNGDVVMIGDGTYTGDGNRDITFRGKAITVKSAGGPYECIIDCEGSADEPHRGFTFENQEGVESILEGVTITNGYVADDQVFLAREGAGGGILCVYSGPTINRCIIKNCYAVYGSAIYSANDYYWEYPDLSATSPVVKNCIIAGNTAYHGGAIEFESASGTVIDNCTITENVLLNDYPQNMGAVVFSGSYYEGAEDVVARNTVIYDNFLDIDSEGFRYVYQIALFGQSGPLLKIENCDIEDGLGGILNYSRSTVEWGVGNIDVDPGFVDAGYWDADSGIYYSTWYEGDYHLSVSSLCINAGSSEGNYAGGQTDIDGDERVMGGQVDIGADEVVMYDAPYLFARPYEFVFNIYENEPESVYQELKISNLGLGGFNWEIAEDCPWLQADKVSGRISGSEVDTVKLSVLGNGLGVGSYTYQFVVSAAAAQNEQQVIEIVLHVFDPLLVPGEYGTIQAAIDAADDGDMVVVEDGVYTGEGNRNIEFKGKAIIVRSMNGTENCIVDCQNENRGFRFISGEGRNSVLDGFTIVNGYKAGAGGGIKVGYGSGPVIQNCVIKDCQASEGGGIYCQSGSDAFIRNSKIVDNDAAEMGGGLYCEGMEEETASITVEGCEISGNNADGSGGGGGLYAEYCQEVNVLNSTLTGNESLQSGGGIRVSSSVNVKIDSCVFAENRSVEGSGGGVKITADNAKITNSIFRDNESEGNGGGIHGGGEYSYDVINCTFVNNVSGNSTGSVSKPGNGIIANSIFKGNSDYAIYGDAVIKHCIFTDNADGDYYDFEQVYNGEEINSLEGCYGNIDDDPMLVNAENGDLRLLAGSPCIDAGENSFVISFTDLGGNPRMVDGDGDGEAVVDIGAYEYPAAIAADIDNSGRVDYADFGLFSLEWLADTRQPVEVGEAARWPFDEGFGTTAHDLSVYGNDGTLSDPSPVWSTSDLNGVLIFNGINNYVEAIGYKGVTGSQSRTCSARIKTMHAGAPILSWGDYNISGARWLLKTASTGALRVSVGGGKIIGSEIVADDNWHHVAAILADDGSLNVSEIKLYVDGIEDTGTTSTPQAIMEGSVNADVLIGAFYSGSYNYYDGIIDDVRIYDVALTDEMIEQLYNGSSPSGWVCTESLEADLNYDCIVDVQDLLVLAENWLWQQ
jgi:concanavalin A-like lectin/glucanase superfamily protein/parallel beta helix pectate lyase-like protein